MPTRPNLNSLFGDLARHSRDIAVVQRRGYRRETWTYGKLSSIARVCAHQLQGRGAVTGDRILIWGPNSAEWMAAFWGCLILGAVAVPLDQGSTPEFAARVARETSARVIVASREAARLLAATDTPPAEPLGNAIPFLILEDLLWIAARQGDILIRAKHDDRPWYESIANQPVNRNHVAQILFTSGTTAEPRGVVLTHGNFLANLEPLERGMDPYRKYERLLHPLRFVTLVPLSHVFGQFMVLFVAPLLGATIVFELSANPSEITHAIKRERATALIAVPRMLDSLRSHLLREFTTSSKTQGSTIGIGAPHLASQPDAVGRTTLQEATPPQDSLSGNSTPTWFPKTFLAAHNQKFLRRAWLFRRIHRRFGWRFWSFISGGAALSADTEEFFKRMGYAVVQGYGMTETASLISLNHPFRAAQGTIGKPLPGREFKIADDGEILVRGDNVSSGYWQSGAMHRTEAGWLCTGDIGELDAEGNLRFRGRKKNVIVTPAGLNVHPEDLEAALRKQPGVRDCVVLPIERDANAEACAALLMDTDGELAAQRAVETANRSLAEFQRMRTWVIWPHADFPRTPTGKPRLAEISAAVARIFGGSALEPPATSTLGGLERMLSRFAHPGGAPSWEQQLNLSSLDRVELMSALEDRYQVELNETSFAEAKTVADIKTLLGKANVEVPESAGSAISALGSQRDPSASSPPQERSQAPAVESANSSRQFKYSYPRWAQVWLVRYLRLVIYYALVWPAAQILGHPKIIGRATLQGLRGPVLVVSNHVTRRADVGLILAALPMRFRHRLAIAMGGETLRRLRRPPRDWLFAKRWSYQLGYWLVTALFNVFPLPRFSGFRESFRFAGESIDRGYSVLVFPEGETNESSTGEMAPFRSGIGLLAENLGVPIIPIRLDGVWQMKRERRRLARIGEITVHIARPVTFSEGIPPEEIAQRLQSLVSGA